jgi:hypothetical protein
MLDLLRGSFHTPAAIKIKKFSLVLFSSLNWVLRLFIVWEASEWTLIFGIGWTLEAIGVENSQHKWPQMASLIFSKQFVHKDLGEFIL